MALKVIQLSLVTLCLTHATAQEDEPHWESIEWSDVWIADADGTELPRVLLVGDSIVRGYYGTVEKTLTGKASCARYTTSKFAGHDAFLAELTLVLDEFDFDVIHINNGLHGWDYSEAEYAESLPALVDTIKKYAPDAKIIWAATTPVRLPDDLSRFGEKNGRVQERNRIAEALMHERGIPVNDLYSLVEDRPNLFGRDGVHFNEEGREVQGRRVADAITEYLPEY